MGEQTVKNITKPVRVYRVSVEPIAHAKPEPQASLDKIFFDYDKSVLRPHSIKIPDRVAAYLKSKSNVKLTITGHCDEFGSDKYNYTLSLSRSKAAKKYLVKSKGIDPARVASMGKGKKEPMSDIQTEEGRQLNRRCEFSYSP